ncbi:hypothetical protein GF312_02900 [Candidatus Poribacteria bacterium]|nr:hypothetical protein [Candidatus Poribacteria bacterium]
MRKIRDCLIYVFVSLTSQLVQNIPRKASLRLGVHLGNLIYQVVKKRRQITLKNLEMAFGKEKSQEEIQQIARRSFQNMGKTMIEFLSSPRYTPEDFKDFVRYEGIENIRPYIEAGKGVIFISAHFGNWEMIMLSVTYFLCPIYAVVQEFKHTKLDSLINNYRSQYDSKVVKKDKAVRDGLRILKNGGILAILADQNAGENGVFIDFFGVLASVPKGPVVMAQRTGAILVNILDTRQEDDTHIITISPPVELENTGDPEQDIIVNTTKFVKYLENTIRKYPDQWLWMHNRWKTRPQKEKS